MILQILIVQILILLIIQKKKKNPKLFNIDEIATIEDTNKAAMEIEKNISLRFIGTLGSPNTPHHNGDADVDEDTVDE